VFRVLISATAGEQLKVEHQYQASEKTWVTIDKYMTADTQVLPKKTRPWMLRVPQLFVMDRMFCDCGQEIIGDEYGHFGCPVHSLDFDRRVNLEPSFIETEDGRELCLCGTELQTVASQFLNIVTGNWESEEQKRCPDCDPADLLASEDGRDYGDESDHIHRLENEGGITN
jgi:hypothetical protein